MKSCLPIDNLGVWLGSGVGWAYRAESCLGGVLAMVKGCPTVVNVPAIEPAGATISQNAKVENLLSLAGFLMTGWGGRVSTGRENTSLLSFRALSFLIFKPFLAIKPFVFNAGLRARSK
jgi:hypothetical protein